MTQAERLLVIGRVLCSEGRTKAPLTWTVVRTACPESPTLKPNRRVIRREGVMLGPREGCVPPSFRLGVHRGTIPGPHARTRDARLGTRPCAESGFDSRRVHSAGSTPRRFQAWRGRRPTGIVARRGSRTLHVPLTEVPSAGATFHDVTSPKSQRQVRGSALATDDRLWTCRPRVRFPPGRLGVRFFTSYGPTVA